MPEAAPQAAGPAATAERGGRRQQVLRLSRADEDEAALPTNGLLGWDSLARLETLSHSRRTFRRTRQRRRQCLPVDELAASPSTSWHRRLQKTIKQQHESTGSPQLDALRSFFRSDQALPDQLILIFLKAGLQKKRVRDLRAMPRRS